MCVSFPVGSLGYFLSSLVSLFTSIGTTDGSREIDRASLFLDAINMMVFIVDGMLFWRLWWKESEEELTWKQKCVSIHSIANACNTFSSVAYLAFVIYALDARYKLQAQEAEHVAKGDKNWYDESIIDVVFKQVTRTHTQMRTNTRRRKSCSSHLTLTNSCVTCASVILLLL